MARKVIPTYPKWAEETILQILGAKTWRLMPGLASLRTTKWPSRGFMVHIADWDFLATSFFFIGPLRIGHELQ